MQELSKESQRQRKTHSMMVVLNVQHETLARTEVGLNDTSVEFRVEWNLEGQGCRVASRRVQETRQIRIAWTSPSDIKSLLQLLFLTT
jgi:hypothetical protein